MVLGGLALALSRLIDNSVVVLENIYRHLEMGEPPVVAAEKGGKEVALPVLAATLTTAIVFFPVTLLYGVSKFLFSAMALAVVVSLFASYFIAMTVVPLFCSKYLKLDHPEGFAKRMPARRARLKAEDRLRGTLQCRLQCPLRDDAGPLRSMGALGASPAGEGAVWLRRGLCSRACGLYGLLGFSYFPQTDAGQFVINFKAPSGTKLSVTEQEVAKAEALIKQFVRPPIWASSSITSASIMDSRRSTPRMPPCIRALSRSG